MMKKPTRNRKSKALAQPTNFQKSVNELRQRKAEIYNRMEFQANDSETIEYYKKASNELSDINLDAI